MVSLSPLQLGIVLQVGLVLLLLLAGLVFWFKKSYAKWQANEKSFNHKISNLEERDERHQEEYTKMVHSLNETEAQFEGLNERLKDCGNNRKSLKNELAELKMRVSELSSFESKYFDADMAITANKVEIEDLKRQLEEASQQQEEENSEGMIALQTHLDMANQMVGMLMATSGEQGTVINFSRNMAGCRELDDLAQVLLDSLGSFGLKACIQLRNRGKTFNFSHEEFITPVNLEKIADTENKERIRSKDEEMLIFYEQLTLLVTNMPVDDDEKCGRLRDHLAIEAELAAAEVDNIAAEKAVEVQRLALKGLVKNTHSTLENVSSQFKGQKEEAGNIVRSLTSVLNNSVFINEMSPENIRLFQDILNESQIRFEELFSKDVAVNDSFSELINNLGQRFSDE